MLPFQRPRGHYHHDQTMSTSAVKSGAAIIVFINFPAGLRFLPPPRDSFPAHSTRFGSIAEACREESVTLRHPRSQRTTGPHRDPLRREVIEKRKAAPTAWTCSASGEAVRREW